MKVYHVDIPNPKFLKESLELGTGNGYYKEQPFENVTSFPTYKKALKFLDDTCNLPPIIADFFISEDDNEV